MTHNMLAIIRNYFSCQPVERAWLFGSHSRGEESVDSDIDIIVRFIPGSNMSLFRHAEIIGELSELLHTPVDIVTEGNLFPWVQQTADQDKQLIYERETQR